MSRNRRTRGAGADKASLSAVCVEAIVCFAPPQTSDIVHAAAWDAGNRSMRKGGRFIWNELDWNAALAELDRLRSAP